MPDFEVQAPFQPAGDQPRAIAELTAGLVRGDKYQTLLGVTGSGKTMTLANVIAAYRKPTLILSHNKTLAAQLYGEMKQFLPGNAVEATWLPAPAEKRLSAAAKATCRSSSCRICARVWRWPRPTATCAPPSSSPRRASSR